MRTDIKTACRKRLNRIEGQVRGLTKMLDADRYCIDIITQIGAVRAALGRVEEELLRDHVGHCVEDDRVDDRVDDSFECEFRRAKKMGAAAD